MSSNKNATGIYMPLRIDRQETKYERHDARALAEQQIGRTLKPSEVSSFWFKRSLDYIFGHPWEWMKLMGRKFLLFHNKVEIPDVIDYQIFKGEARFLHITVISFFLLFP